MGGRRLLLWFIQLYIFNHPLPLAETFLIGGGGGGGGSQSFGEETAFPSRTLLKYHCNYRATAGPSIMVNNTEYSMTHLLTVLFLCCSQSEEHKIDTTCCQPTL